MNDRIFARRSVALINLRNERPAVVELIAWELGQRRHSAASRALSAWRADGRHRDYERLVKAVSAVLWHYNTGYSRRPAPAGAVVVCGQRYRVYSSAARSDCACSCGHSRYLGFCADCDTPAFHRHDNDRVQCCHHLAMRARMRVVWPQGQYQT